MELRDYQLKAKAAIYQHWRSGQQGVFLCLPTGAGKTVTFASIIEDALKRHCKICLLAHRQELLQQAHSTL